MSSMVLTLRPRIFSAFEESAIPGLDFLVPFAGSCPDATAFGNFSEAILVTSSQMMSVWVSESTSSIEDAVCAYFR